MALPPRDGLPIEVRFARRGDVGALARLYRQRSDRSKALYHPFPFDPVRIRLILAWLTLDRPLIPFLMRWWSRRFGVVVVAAPRDGGRPVGYGTVRPRRSASGEWMAQFGYLVDDAYQGQGIGARLMEAMARASIALGIRRGVGTILASNAANLRLTQRYGWTVMGAGTHDRNSPGELNYEVTVDLEEILRRRSAEPGSS